MATIPYLGHLWASTETIDRIDTWLRTGIIKTRIQEAQR